MDREVFKKRIFKARRSTGTAGMSLSLPTELRDRGLISPGDEVELLYSDKGMVVIAPLGMVIDQAKLAMALELATN